jgi:hypothetical protein
MDVTYWQDYMTIAEEARGESRLRSTLYGAWRYHGSLPEHYMLLTEDRRAVAAAILDTMHGRESDGLARLETYVSEATANEDTCVSRIILAELEFRLDRTDTARTVLLGANETCRSNIEAVTLTNRIASAEAAPTSTPPRGRQALETTRLQAYVEVRSALNTVDEHRADVEDVVLREPTRLEYWRELWSMLQFNSSSQREYDKVVALANRMSPSAEVDVARMYAELGRGHFERARKQAENLLKRVPNNSHINAAFVLAGATLGGGLLKYSSAFDKVQASNPYLAACLQSEEIYRCLARDKQCVLGSIACTGSEEFVLEAFDRGWPIRFPLQLKKYFERELRMESVARIDGAQRLRAELLARASLQEERLEALRTRIDLAISPAILTLQDRVAATELTQQQSAEELDRLRRETRSRIERMARDFSVQIRDAGGSVAMTQADIAHFSMRLAANEAALAGPRIDGILPTLKSYSMHHPDDSTAVAESLARQVRSAARATGDTTEMFGAIADDCSHLEQSGFPCLRSIVKLVKKHVSIQAPVVPTLISVDMLGVYDTLVEFLSKLLSAHDQELPELPRL